MFAAPRVLMVAVAGLLLAVTAQAAELPHVQPAEAGFAADKLQAVTALLEEHVQQKQLSGAVALVLRNGKVVYSEAVGWRDAEADEPMTEDTIFRIASMTKPVTSVAVMILHEEGKLNLDDPVSKYVPEFAEPTVLASSTGAAGETQFATVPAEREITIHDLLTHTSGMIYPFSGDGALNTLYRRAEVTQGLSQTPLTTAENIERLAGLPLKHQPGQMWTYGLSTDVLGRVVEVASGQPFDQFLQQRILDPLGMDDTHFFLPADKRQRLAALYRPTAAGQIERVPEGVVQEGTLTYSSDFHYAGPQRYVSGGAGLASTAEDYARFLQMLTNGGQFEGQRILKAETVKTMTTNQIGDLAILYRVHGDKFGYGFGIASQALSTGAPTGSYSWGGIFNTFFWIDPQQEIAGIVMTQLYPFGHLPLWADFQTRVYEALEEPVASGQQDSK